MTHAWKQESHAMHQKLELELCYFIAIQMEVSVLPPVHQRHYHLLSAGIQILPEVLAVIFVLQQFHHFLHRQKFILVMDHKPLVAKFNPAKGISTIVANRLA